MSIYFFSPKIIFLSSKKYIKTYSHAMLYINGHDQDGNDDDVAMLKATVQNNKIECAWKIVYSADDDEHGQQTGEKRKRLTLPEYATFRG